MLKIKDSSRPPKGMQWHYDDPETGHRISNLHFDVLRKNVRDYRNKNNLPIGSQWDDTMEEIVCKNADPYDCEDFNPPTPAAKLASLGRFLKTVMAGSAKIASAELVTDRLAICQECNYFTGVHSLFRVGCRACGCGGVKAHFATEKCIRGKW